MTEFWKATAIVLLAAILGSAIGKNERDIAIVLNITACCVAAMVAIKYLLPVFDYIWNLSSSVQTAAPAINILLRITGIAILTELTGVISTDAGSGSLGKSVQFMGSAAIFYQTIPLFESFFSIIFDVLNVL